MDIPSFPVFVSGETARKVFDWREGITARLYARDMAALRRGQDLASLKPTGDADVALLCGSSPCLTFDLDPSQCMQQTRQILRHWRGRSP